MLFRLAFLVPLTCLVAVESNKLEEILKNLGKRFFPVEPEIKKIQGERKQAVDFSDFDRNYIKWIKLNDYQIHKIKVGTALRVLDTFIEISSTENRLFNDSLKWLESIMDPEMTAEICGEKDKKMNAYQYMKFLTHFGSQHKGVVKKPRYVEIIDDGRDSLRMKMDINHTDKFNLEAKIEYDITMKLTFINEKKGSLFSLHRVYQGGSCSEHGIVSYSKSDQIDMTIDNIEELKSHPNARSLLKFFTPQVYQLVDEDPLRIPMFWLAGLQKDVSKISVCQEGITEPVDYSIAQFRRWYNAFAKMWHLKKDYDQDSIGLQVLEVKEEFIIARITMKLQMGLDETLHDWNFKVSAKKNPFDYRHIIQTDWHIEQLEVMCTPTIQYKDQSLKSIRDTVAQKFVNELIDLPDPTQWHSSVEFVNQFTKNGELEGFQYCGSEKTKTPQLDLFKLDKSVQHIVKYTKYSVDHPDISSPASDSASFTFKTISIDESKIEYENEWKFELKWDQMDQFYYVEQMEIGCHKKKDNGNYEGYLDIDYGTGN